jgi:hypothetical protein
MQLESLEIPIKAIDNAFKASLAGAASLVAGFTAGAVAAVKATEKWAGELDSIQDVIGGTAKDAAAFNFVLRKSKTDTDTFTKGLVVLGKGLVDADGRLDTTGKALKDWGINVLDSNGALKDQSALIEEISGKYNAFGTQQERINFLTEVFGKSGANLVDFFDTLASEGGIDAVTEKVERFGLAIDPGRYEQFNRNLEELKLIGLGLAVSFTEKVMPALENFLELVSNPSEIDASKIVAWADNAIGSFVKGLGDSINNWVSGGGPEELSENLISWIEGIGDSEAVKSKTQIAMEHLVRAMGEALANMDWAGIQEAFGAKIDEMFAANRPRGENAIADFWDTLEVAGTNAMRTALGNWAAEVSNWINTNLVQRFQIGALLAGQMAANGLAQTIPSFIAVLSNLRGLLETKLGDISKTFEQKAYSWVNKAVDAFNQTKGKITSAITAVVVEINRILSKIISTFQLTFNGVNWGGGNTGGATGDATGTLGQNSASPGTTGVHAPGGGRASGGPVIGGVTYSVAEFFKPERFTPAVSGRIDPIEDKQMSFEIDYNRLGSVIASQVVKAMNNA